MKSKNRKEDYMCENNNKAIKKTVGKTTYIVSAHFKESDAETLQDKINRMIKDEVESKK